MVSANVINDINSLQADRQTVVLSLKKSLANQERYRTDAQRSFEEDCKEYDSRKPLSMSEIAAMIHEA